MEKSHLNEQLQKEVVVSAEERKRELCERLGILHDHCETRIQDVYRNMDSVRKKYPKEKWFWPNKPADYMAPEDHAEYEALSNEVLQFQIKVLETIKELFDVSKEDVSSWALKDSKIHLPARKYNSFLNDNYELQIGWYDAPLDDGQVAESFREYYYLTVVGSKEIMTRKGVAGIGKKVERKEFPYLDYQLSISENDNGQFEPSGKTLEHFDPEDAKQFCRELLELGMKLRERWG